MSRDGFTDAQWKAIQKAAGRWGLSEPSMDDIISKFCPRYAPQWDGPPYQTDRKSGRERRTKAKKIREHDQEHVALWRRMMNAALDLVLEPDEGRPERSQRVRRAPRARIRKIKSDVQIQVYLDYLDGVPYHLIMEKHRVTRKEIAWVAQEHGGVDHHLKRKHPERMNVWMPK